MPDIRFAKSGDVHVAFQVLGDGPVDIVWIYDWVSNLEIQWELPEYGRFLRRLASFSRLLMFDKRGCGLSDRTVDPDLFTLDVRLDDVRAVMATAGSGRAFIFGHGDDGASLAAVFAATHPEQTSGLILYGARARDVSTDDYTMGYAQTDPTVWNSEAENFWGSDAYARRWLAALAPSVAHDKRVLAWYSRLLRQSASPGSEIAFESAVNDIRAALPAIHVPTLVLHRSGDTDVPIEAGRDLAQRIPGALLVELAGIDSYPWAGDQDSILDQVETFVHGSRASTGVDRMLATILFTDIVGSTETAARLGDHAWKALLGQHDDLTRQLVQRFRGHYVHTTGDGLLATFDGPARAVRCAQAITSHCPPSVCRSAPAATPERSKSPGTTCEVSECTSEPGSPHWPEPPRFGSPRPSKISSLAPGSPSETPGSIR